LERSLALIRFAAQLAHNDGLHADWTAIIQSPQTSVDVAPELLLEWATSPGQTPERLKSAIEAIRAAERHFPPLGQIFIGDYLHTCDVVAGQDVPEFTHRWSHNASESDETKLYERLAVVLNDLPWERQRALLAVGVLATLSLDDVAGIEDGRFDAAQIRSRLSSFGHYEHVTLNRNSVEQERDRFRALRTAESSLLVSLQWGCRVSINSYLRHRLMFQTGLALERTRLALIAFYLDHGRYPDSLFQLIPDYLKRPEADRFFGVTFQYERAGFDAPVYGANHVFPFSYVSDVPAHTPVIWTVGPDNVTPTEQLQQLGAANDESNTLNEGEPDLEMVALFVPHGGWMRSTIVLSLPLKVDATAD
jgi:hypothetical protein